VASNRFGRGNGQDLTLTTRPAFTLANNFTELGPESMVLADITGDGVLDLIRSGGTGYGVTFGYSGVLADRDFENWFSLAGLVRSQIAPGDFDNDGDVDFFISGYHSNAPQAMLWQNFSGNWNLTNATHGMVAVDYSAAAWGDYDNDGDLDLAISGLSDTGNVCRVYRNDDGLLNHIAAELTGVSAGSLDWGDYDNDGDLDLLVTGTLSGFLSGGICRIYRNDNGTFVNLGLPLIGASFKGAAAWCDFDNDGDLDFAAGGWNSSVVPQTTIYRNDGAGVFTNINAGLPGISYGSLAWADFDSDGLPDLLLTGSTNGLPEGGLIRLFRQSLSGGTRVFTAVLGFFSLTQSEVVWGDCSGDGVLDFLFSGLVIPQSQLYVAWLEHGRSLPNQPPGPSAALGTMIQSNRVTFSWNAATDTETPPAALTYNLRVGTAPGGAQIMSPHARLSDGLLSIPAMGNVQQGTNAWLRLPPGTYYWSVQAVDGAFAGSSFAPEQSFTVAGETEPALSVRRKLTNSVVVSWPSPSTGFSLQQAIDLTTPVWNPPAENTSDDGTNKSIIVNPPARNRFYRLLKP
jgi:hypothetical protein